MTAASPAACPGGPGVRHQVLVKPTRHELVSLCGNQTSCVRCRDPRGDAERRPRPTEHHCEFLKGLVSMFNARLRYVGSQLLTLSLLRQEWIRLNPRVRYFSGFIHALTTVEKRIHLPPSFAHTGVAIKYVSQTS